MFVTSRFAHDCVVTALANYTQHTYDEVLTTLDKIRRPLEGVQHGRGYYRDTWLFALACLMARQPREAGLLTDGMLRLKHINDEPGHLVVIRRDGTVIDGSLAHSDKYSLTRYLEVYPVYEVDEVWQ